MNSVTKLKLGILGGGQLGAMMTPFALDLGFEVHVLDPGDNPPAEQRGAIATKGSFVDRDDILNFATKCDILTWEIEHVDAQTLIELQDAGTVKVSPDPKMLAVLQDKLTQKQLMESKGILVPQFVEITNESEIENFLDKVDNGVMLKSRRGGYDGRGNYVVNSKSDIKDALEYFAGAELLAEEMIDLDREVSVIFTRSDNETKTYLPVDMINENNICHLVISPSQAEEEITAQAQAMAKKVAENLEGNGTFAVEMLVDKEDKVYLNEIAPRVHNSGHHTLGGAETSQFEQHVRAVAGMDLGSEKQVADNVVMLNILGTENKPVPEDLQMPETEGGNIVWYGKSPVKVERKMGHITILSKPGESVEDMIVRVKLVREAIDI